MSGKFNDFEILIGEGLSRLKFGMTQSEVLEEYGEPDEKETLSYEDNDELKTHVWHYDQDGISLTFDNVEEYLLTSISTTNENILIKGEKIIGCDYSELCVILDKLDISDYEEVDWNPQGDEDYTIFSEQAGMNFWFENGELREVEWSEIISNEDFVMWLSTEEE